MPGSIDAEYRNRKNDLLIERDQLEAEPAAASIAPQRQRIESIVEDWSVMTDEEKKRVLQMIFSEIRADQTEDGLKIEFRPKPIWEPHLEGPGATKASAGQPGSSRTSVAGSNWKGRAYLNPVRSARMRRADRPMLQ